MKKINISFLAKIFLCLLFSLFVNVKAFSLEELENENTIINYENVINDSTVTPEMLVNSDVLDDEIINEIINNDDAEEEIIKPPKEIYKLNKHLGSLFLANNTISFREITRINYCTMTEILIQEQTSFPLFTGLLGGNNAFSIFGATPNENALLLNGVSLFNLYGCENFNIVSPEFSNQIEILRGSESVILAGKSGITANIQTPIFNTAKPYSRIWFTQGDNKLIGVDGTYSQNFAPNWNLTTGFRRLSANSYYQNSFFDSWNARIMLRNNLSDLSAISLLYHFSNYYTGDFGGIFFADYNTNSNRHLLRSNFSNLSNRQYRTDFILSHSALTADSNLIVNSNLFFNHSENNILFRNEKELLKIDSSGRNISHGTNYGINTNLKYNLFEKISFDFGGELFYVKVPNSVITKDFEGLGYKVFGLTNAKISSLKISFGGRFANKYDKQLIGYGGNISKYFNSKNSNEKNNSKSKIYIDASYCDAEPIPVFNYKFEKHSLGLLGFQFEKNKFLLDMNLFFRQINNSLFLNFSPNNIYSFSPSVWGKDHHHIFGFAGKVNFEFIKNMDFSLTVQNFFDNIQIISEGQAKPKFYFTNKIQYNYVKATSQFNVGLMGSFLVNARKMYYNPIFKSYGFSELESSFATDGLTAFFSGKFGNAFFRASFKNIIGTNFSYLAYYPTLKQELCISVTWAFPSGSK